jgi:hypothetical protein
VGWVVVEVANAFRSCHDVEIVGFVSVRDNHGVGASRHEDDIAVFNGHGLVKVTRVAAANRGGVLKNAHASADFLPIESLGLSGDYSGQNDHAKLVGVVGKAQSLRTSACFISSPPGSWSEVAQ